MSDDVAATSSGEIQLNKRGSKVRPMTRRAQSPPGPTGMVGEVDVRAAGEEHVHRPRVSERRGGQQRRRALGGAAVDVGIGGDELARDVDEGLAGLRSPRHQVTFNSRNEGVLKCSPDDVEKESIILPPPVTTVVEAALRCLVQQRVAPRRHRVLVVEVQVGS